MKFVGVSRAAASCVGVALIVWAQASAFCQPGAPATQIVVAKNEAYLVGTTQMVAPANADFEPHPQGRYALVTQSEAALPPGPLLGRSTTGAVSLSLYDARLNKTRTLLQRRADGGKHTVESVKWLPQTDCALVIVRDVPSPDPSQGSSPVDVNNDLTNTYASDFFVNGKTVSSTLLFYDFSKSLTPRVLGTSADGFYLSVSPIKPIFVVIDDDKNTRIGSAPSGALGPVRVLPPRTIHWGWNTEGTSIYERQIDTVKASPDTEPQRVEKWRLWDGRSADAVELKTKPTKAMFAQEPTPAPLPIVLQIGNLPVPSDLSKSRVLTEERAFAFAPITPQTQSAAKTATATKPLAQTPKPQTGTVFHPLYLAPTDAAHVPTETPDNTALLAPDAPGGAILADQSAVLYHSGGAVYAVPLVRVKTAAWAALRKQRAMQQGKQVGLGILMYVQDYDEEYPLSDRFAESVSPYLKDPSMFNGFTFNRPSVPLSKIPMPATTVMGYVTAPGGRAVVYVDGHVKWEDTP